MIIYAFVWPRSTCEQHFGRKILLQVKRSAVSISIKLERQEFITNLRAPENLARAGAPNKHNINELKEK